MGHPRCPWLLLVEGTRFSAPRPLRGGRLDRGSRPSLKRACDSPYRKWRDAVTVGARARSGWGYEFLLKPRVSSETQPRAEQPGLRWRLCPHGHPHRESHALLQTKTYETDTAALARGLCLAAETVRRRSMRGTETPGRRECETRLTCDNQNQVADKQRREWAETRNGELRHHKGTFDSGSVPRRRRRSGVE